MLWDICQDHLQIFRRSNALRDNMFHDSADSTRKATARCVIAYFDGSELQLFESSLDGQIAFQPAGNNGFGWDKIFIPHDHTVTKASLSNTEYKKTYLQIKPLDQLKTFLESKY